MGGPWTNCPIGTPYGQVNHVIATTPIAYLWDGTTVGHVYLVDLWLQGRPMIQLLQLVLVQVCHAHLPGHALMEECLRLLPDWYHVFQSELRRWFRGERENNRIHM